MSQNLPMKPLFRIFCEVRGLKTKKKQFTGHFQPVHNFLKGFRELKTKEKKTSLQVIFSLFSPFYFIKFSCTDFKRFATIIFFFYYLTMKTRQLAKNQFGCRDIPRAVSSVVLIESS